MTEVASRAAQGQSIIDTISRSGSSKPGAQMRAASRSTPKAHDADVADDQVRDRPADKADVRDQRAASKSVDTSAKVSEKPHRENEGDDGSETSFEATIDTLGSQASSGNAQATILANPPTVWNTAPAQGAAQDQTSNDDSQSAAPNVKSATIPGHILKQASIVALLDARQRLMAAQDTTPATKPAVEETVTAPIAVHSREAHWIFDDPNAGSRARVSETSANKGITENPLSALAAATASKSDDGMAKLSSDMTLAARAEQTPAADAAPQQNFNGAQGGRSGSREQSGSSDASPRRISDASAVAPAEHITHETPETPDIMSAATQQVRSGVLTALADDSGSAETFSPRQIPDRPPVAGQVLRTIDLTLSPPDLGTVRLKLTLKASALDINAETSKAATAKLLDDDRKGLEQSLRDAGYDVKSLKVSDISASFNSNLNSSLNNGGSSFQDGSQARANLGGRQDDGMPRREGGMPDQSQQRRRDDSQKSSAAEVASGRQANAIYI
ncbi:MAG: flagellar hook-length control protein FliK [Hyphomicrobium sp.]|uniref:flagellar hook-length control protein FliK n=1 Tax=Hyphomicrobium sp. TaxID=82 RepID=UPI003569343F